MSFTHDIRELRGVLISWLILFLALGFGFFVLPTGESVAARVFAQMKANLIPPGVELVVVNPMTAFFGQFQIAFVLALLISLPYLLWRLLRYVLPGLYAHETRALLLFLVPSCLLFFVGSAFAYWFLIPSMFRFLYAYVSPLGATSFFALQDFIALTFSILFVTGLAFLLPVAMVLLTKAGVVRAGAWGGQWRKGLLVFLIVSAVITPDGSGVSMILLSFPLFALYVLGALVSSKMRS